MNKILATLALALTIASTSAQAGHNNGTQDLIKGIGVLIILDSVFGNNNNHSHNNNNHNNGGYIQDDRGVYQRQCSGNLGCSPQDNNRWNNPRKHGYAKGRNSNGSSNGQVCGQRVEHFRDYSETLHLSCNGDVLYVTRHRK